MLIKEIVFNSDEYKQMLDLRNAVLRKPINWPYFVWGQTEHEKEYTLLGGFDETTNEILACCILVHKSDTEIQLKQMAVYSTHQGKNLGLALIRFAENWAIKKRYTKLSMHARKTALGFYEKSGYGISGDEFEEVGIPHFKMEKQL
jgi:predicted GNAT family N-acyltransferase